MNQKAAGIGLKIRSRIKGGGVGIGTVAEYLGTGGLRLLGSGCLVGAVGVSLCSRLTGGSGRSIRSGAAGGCGGSSAAAGCHTKQHGEAEHDCDDFFHVSYPS